MTQLGFQPLHGTLSTIVAIPRNNVYTVEPPNDGHIGDKHFVHCSVVVPCSEVEMYGQYIGRGRGVCPL